MVGKQIYKKSDLRTLKNQLLKSFKIVVLKFCNVIDKYNIFSLSVSSENLTELPDLVSSEGN